ncbi:DNA replication/repair protein RecF [Caenibius sp. WL]|uniref:DNA replication/repair protein RecF n=1 Tax=Caenibius sp. WL TaxID=2872646 RepID=UPI001C997AE9|nr:DNA replication/repair protein RecF [Caenibius sp. WL]QZP07813.1 DNA replication/repair protein RecF [Caenibius sp. WL]
MALDRITLSRFRNHGESRLDGTAHFNLLIGENGAGKTNVLEALSLLAPGRGLRRAALTDIPQKQAGGGPASGFAISARLDSGDGGEPVLIGTGTREDRLTRRLVQINGADSSAMALGEWLAVSWLTPAMDGLFTDSAGARRRYMDRLALALDPAHARHASRYEAALRERNRLLDSDSEPDPQWLDAVEAGLAQHGAALAAGRARLVERLMGELAALPDQPFARPALDYAANAPDSEQALAMELRSQRPRDRAARRTLNGPHRDDLTVMMAGKDIPAAYCSTGEQKAMLIAITLAHAGLAARGRPGVLLLDEVAAHLDPVRREALFERLRLGAAQVWMTGTERAPFATIATDLAVWRVSGGKVERTG